MRWVSIATVTGFRTTVSIGRSATSLRCADEAHDLRVVRLDLGDAVGARVLETVADQNASSRLDQGHDGGARTRRSAWGSSAAPRTVNSAVNYKVDAEL